MKFTPGHQRRGEEKRFLKKMKKKKNETGRAIFSREPQRTHAGARREKVPPPSFEVHNGEGFGLLCAQLGPRPTAQKRVRHQAIETPPVTDVRPTSTHTASKQTAPHHVL